MSHLYGNKRNGPNQGNNNSNNIGNLNRSLTDSMTIAVLVAHGASQVASLSPPPNNSRLLLGRRHNDDRNVTIEVLEILDEVLAIIDSDDFGTTSSTTDATARAL